MKGLLFLFLFIVSLDVYADNTYLADQVRYKEEVLNTLKKEIQQIDSEMQRCEKSKKGWVAATVVGGVGVVATGTAAIVQGVKLHQKNNPKPEPKEEKK